MIRVLLFAEVDLNLIDGSSIWLASLAELLSDSPEINVTVLLRTPLQRDVVVRQIKSRHNVSLLNPWDEASKDRRLADLLSNNRTQRLQADTAVAFIEELDQRQPPYDVVIVRSVDAAYALTNSSRIAARTWAYVTDPIHHASGSETAKLKVTFQQCGRFLCQTQEARSVFMQILDVDYSEKITILPPMVPAVNSQIQTRLDFSQPRLGYSGKFSPPYMIREMLDAFKKIRERIPEAEFHVVGDKFHNSPPVHNFIEDVTRRLQKTKGVIWHGGVSRAEANEIMGNVHVASSWRDKSFDDSVEMSTKILEYSALGIPVLMNPSTVQYRIFGADYPTYVESKQEFVDTFTALTTSHELYEQVSEHVRKTAQQFTFESTLDKLLPLLRSDSPAVSLDGSRKILFAGHDFRFIEPVTAHYQADPRYKVLFDKYEGHVITDTNRSHQLLKHADIIFCEWCLGNVEWYSRHKKDNQRLIVRLHAQEIRDDVPFLQTIDWKKVDQIVFICQHNMDRFLDRFPFMSDRAILIYNPIHCDSFRFPKLFGAEFNLGMMGFVPKLKAPHIAFDIFRELKKIDSRYTLFFKGSHPWEYDWLWQRPEEREYYEALYAKINSSEFANSVVFDPHDNAVPDWFSKIGFLLSTSDQEGSHQAVAEAMASGTTPIIRNWPGSDTLYPGRLVFNSENEAVKLVLELNTKGNFLNECQGASQFAMDRFDQQVILRKYDQLVSSILKMPVNVF